MEFMSFLLKLYQSCAIKLKAQCEFHAAHCFIVLHYTESSAMTEVE